MKINVFIANSLDGFIAEENGGIEWLSNLSSLEESDFGFKSFYDSIDAILMGRNTFQTIQSFTDYPYPNKKLYVLSTTLKKEDLNPKYSQELIEGNPSEIKELIQKKGHENIYLDGGITIQNFLKEGLVDTLIVSIVPILLGKGIKLFGEISKTIPLKHIETRVFSNGLVQNSYKCIFHENK
jgi:dihydrofolate reductase